MIRGSVKKVGAFLLAVVLAGPAIIAPAVIAPASELKLAFDDRAALEISRNAIGGTIGDYRFVDHRGRTVRLAELKGRPLVVSLVYTACYQTCPLTTVNLVRAVAEADSKLGADRFGVVTLGFDTRFDTPDHMAAFARGQGIDRRGWLVLSSDDNTMRGISADLGFVYFPSPRGFDHLVQTTVLDASGRVYRQLYGTDVSTDELTAALQDLTSGRAVEFVRGDGWVDRLRLLCSTYDPTRGRYLVDYSFALTLIIGGTCFAGVAVFLIRAWRENRGSRQV